MPNIIGEQIRSYVASQITHRQYAHASGQQDVTRTPEYIAYLNSKTAWVKLASGINISKDRLKKDDILEGYYGDVLSRDNILSAGTSRLDRASKTLIQRGTVPTTNIMYDSYGGVYNVNNTINPTNPEFGLVPMPGIESAEIRCLNRGSIKKATVKIKCYSPEQFKTINLLYLRLGYTVLLEWGNSLYLNNSWENPELIRMEHSLIEAEDGFFSENAAHRTHTHLLDRIGKYRASNFGNYDGLVAKVVNFSWDFSPDGSYDINLELISLGDVIESLKVNITPSTKISTFIKEAYVLFNEDAGDATKDISPTPIDNIISSYLFIQKLYLDKQNGKDKWLSTYDKNDSRQAKREVTVSVQDKIIEIGGQFIDPKDKTLNISNRVYLDFDTEQECQDHMKQYEPPAKQFDSYDDYYSNGENTSLGVSYNIVDKGFWQRLYISTNITEKFYEDSEIKKTDVCYLNYLNSFDANNISDSGFYMRFGHLLDFIKDYVIPVEKTTGDKQIKISSDQYNSIMHTFPYQISLDPRVCIVNSGEPVKTKKFFKELPTWKKDGYAYAWTMNIYLNQEMIQSSLSSNMNDKGNVNLFEFLTSICTELNKALGGINNLEPVIDEEDNTIYIIDHNYQPIPKPHIYDLELYGYNKESSNFVRSFNLRTEITPEFATMATIGSTAGGYTKGVENTMFSKWNKGLIDRYKEEYVAGDEDSRPKSGSVPEAVENYLNDFYNKAGSNPFGWTTVDIDWDLGENTQDLNAEIIDNNVSVVTEFFKYCQTYIQTEKEEKYSSPHNGFIPINLGITMDGISGIKIYNALNVSTRFLPSDYPDNLQFIVKGVNHKISNQDWETTLETIVISKSENDDKTSPSKALTYTQIKAYVDELLKTTQINVLNNPPPSKQDGTTPPSQPPTNDSNTGLEKYTKESAINQFQSAGEQKAQCGSYTYTIARLLAQKLKNKTITAVKGNHAHSKTIRNNLSNLGIYKPESLTPVGVGLTPSQASQKANEITKQANYGDALIYFATPPPRGDSPDYRFHAQIYTGNQYASIGGKGWSSSFKKNYGVNFVYASRNTTPYTMYWFRIKDEYKK